MAPGCWQKKALRWFGNKVYDNDDDYPDFATPGARAALCHDDYSARKGVEEDDLIILCQGGRATGFAVACDCTKNFLGARFSVVDRYRRRMAKVTQLEASTIGDCR